MEDKDSKTPEILSVRSSRQVALLVGLTWVSVIGSATVALKLGEFCEIFLGPSCIGRLTYSSQRISDDGDTIIPVIERSFDPENRLRGLSIFDPDLDSDVTWAFSIEAPGGGDDPSRANIDLAQENSRASKKARGF